ncbi:hypothetical protein HG530_007983 [Fusarium avenaceum]|nr:hypothetical protein HG530_007983 [Fusarium avenaceum]
MEKAKGVVKTLRNLSAQVETIIQDRLSRSVTNNDTDVLTSLNGNSSSTILKSDIRRLATLTVNSNGGNEFSIGRNLSRNLATGNLKRNNIRSHIARLATRLGLVRATARSLNIAEVDLLALLEENLLSSSVSNINIGHTSPVATNNIADGNVFGNAGEGMKGGLVATLLVLAVNNNLVRVTEDLLQFDLGGRSLLVMVLSGGRADVGGLVGVGNPVGESLPPSTSSALVNPGLLVVVQTMTVLVDSDARDSEVLVNDFEPGQPSLVIRVHHTSSVVQRANGVDVSLVWSTTVALVVERQTGRAPLESSHEAVVRALEHVDSLGCLIGRCSVDTEVGRVFKVAATRANIGIRSVRGRCRRGSDSLGKSVSTSGEKADSGSLLVEEAHCSE